MRPRRTSALRDGQKAVTDARRACELSGWSDPNALEALAAASAEKGDFAEAERRQLAAVQLAAGNHRQLSEAIERLALYHEGKPFREKPVPGGDGK